MAKDDRIPELIEEVRGLRQELRELRATLNPSSSSADATLLREIYRAAENLPFASVDLILRVEIVFGESGDTALSDAIVAVVGSLNCRKLGRWIADNEGVSTGGYCIRRAARSGRDGVLWVCESEAGQTHCAKAKAAR